MGGFCFQGVFIWSNIFRVGDLRGFLSGPPCTFLNRSAVSRWAALGNKNIPRGKVPIGKHSESSRKFDLRNWSVLNNHAISRLSSFELETTSANAHGNFREKIIYPWYRWVIGAQTLRGDCEERGISRLLVRPGSHNSRTLNRGLFSLACSIENGPIDRKLEILKVEIPSARPDRKNHLETFAAGDFLEGSTQRPAQKFWPYCNWEMFYKM